MGSPMTNSNYVCDRSVERSGPILKERLFGLTNGEGNHGEDVKEDAPGFHPDKTVIVS